MLADPTPGQGVRLLMINTICWNARRINTQGSLERLQNLKKMHKLSVIAILEPFADNSHINKYKLLLSMDSSLCNRMAKYGSSGQ